MIAIVHYCVAHNCINSPVRNATNMAIDLHMCEPTDSTGYGSCSTVLKLVTPPNAPIGNKELVETFSDLDSTTHEHACCYEDCKKKNKKY